MLMRLPATGATEATPRTLTSGPELQAEVAKDSKLTVAGLLAELEEARAKATDLKQLSAAVRACEAKARVGGLLIQKMEIGGPGSFDPKSETPEGVVREWLEAEANLPELTAFYRFTDEDRAFLVARFNEIFDLMHQRQQDAREARNQSLMPAYKRTISATANRPGNGKTSPL
jgi:hypothetical protein